MMRHSWGEPERFGFKTERACKQCDIVKVTRHEGREHWIEFWRAGERIDTKKTPPCDAMSSLPSAQGATK